ncbi:MAG: BMP family ABC transporter substrate-binding protein [Spirochaetaceae bacterium]|jgi:basic membrane protein A|nr:BMP family ABC transporter substrate-binding protein [Spirochaetaceae bacterium]
MKGAVKKQLVLMGICALTALLAACGGSGKSAKTSGDSPAQGKKLKVVLCVGRKNDLSFQQSAHEGMLRVAAELGQYYDVETREMGDDPTIWESAIYEAADDGADIIMSIAYQNKQNFETIPREYPNTKFILFDQDINYSLGDLSNVLCVLFDSNESGFLAGAVAAYYTVSPKAANPDKIVGFVGGIEAITISNFLVGYAEGAHYVDPQTKIKLAYVGGFVDTAKAKDLAVAQMSEGADIIFQVAGGAGNGVIEAAAERPGVMAIGVDADQYRTLAGTDLQDSVITSSLKRLDNAVVKILGDYARDPGSIPFGTTITYGLEQDAVGIVFNENLSAHLSAENVEGVKTLLEKIRSGEIVVSKAKDLTPQQINAIVNR